MSSPRGANSAGGGKYLSIREVLDELLGEFDDITISKIRFLESRGLIQPERTPSGYRKFFRSDVERLRWILRQQRENFLPLKVIKRRLDLEAGKVPDLPDTPSLFDDALDLESTDLELASVVSKIRRASRERIGPTLHEADSHRAVVNDSIATRVNGQREVVPPKAHLAALPTPLEPSSERNGIAGEQAVRHPNHPSQMEGTEVISVTEDAERESPRQVASAVATGASLSGKNIAHRAEGDSTDPRRVSEEVGDVTAAEMRSATLPSNSTHRSTSSHPPLNELAGVTFTIDELAAAVSLSVSQVAELEEYGFLQSHLVAGDRCFDADALLVAKTVALLCTHGLEPRHLKSIRMAAERDAALYAQVVTPLLRQRNPESRARARDELQELADRGAQLYEQILRIELRRLGG